MNSLPKDLPLPVFLKKFIYLTIQEYKAYISMCVQL